MFNEVDLEDDSTTISTESDNFSSQHNTFKTFKYLQTISEDKLTVFLGKLDIAKVTLTMLLASPQLLFAEKL